MIYMSHFDIMPTIPNVNIPISSSPHRPTPKFFNEAKTFSTKKERGSTPRSNYIPRPPIKSCPPISRVFPHVSTSDRARVISFKNSTEDSLSPSYDSERRDLYFQQCFHIERKLGAGSFGDVYQVRSKEDGQHYAVKRSRDRYKGELDRRRKLEEVSKHETLPLHPNCVRFYKAWEERQHLYIQTELCEASLANLAESEHEIPEKLIWNYLIDLLMAVKHLHDHDMIHMDIKPENIFIAKDGTCQLGDFGLILDLSKSTDLSEAQEGDPKYLAPELMRGRFTKAADIFSLGITILELATDLDLPRGDEGWHQLRNAILPADIVKDRLSPELEKILMIMMEPEYTDRASAAALLDLPIIKRKRQYNAVSQYLNKKREAALSSAMMFWCYFVQFVYLACGYLTGRPSHDTLDMSAHHSDSIDCRSNSSLSSSIAGHINSSWETSVTDGEVFGYDDDSISMMAHTLDFSSDSNESNDLTLRVVESKALTTGARRRPVRTARLLGAVDSPVKTPSQGSPMLLMSSRSSRSSVIPPKEPSSTTPPSCRKLFDDVEEQPQIGPKNLMAAFDTAESDGEAH